MAKAARRRSPAKASNRAIIKPIGLAPAMEELRYALSVVISLTCYPFELDPLPSSALICAIVVDSDSSACSAFVYMAVS